MKSQIKLQMKKKTLAIVIGLIIILSIGIPFAFEISKAKMEEQQKYYESWLPDNCNCLERERKTCSFEGYEVEGNYCVKGGNFTYVAKACSVYNCSEGIYDFNLDKQIWEVQS
ncbi:hypothetical protein COU59_01625 [Candidatus Pacearchaeota archaeon CG10_big_fil_rev_8_21_14_0_10_34_12]|nr:MAG: hypothetical protein COU59_01625 [Candidatus Pacearchaeota archaeon CG10_big_fil_rev_8_21_14_0_10_34_12]